MTDFHTVVNTAAAFGMTLVQPEDQRKGNKDNIHIIWQVEYISNISLLSVRVFIDSQRQMSSCFLPHTEDTTVELLQISILIIFDKIKHLFIQRLNSLL